ncbi:hypothetical protein Cni_G29121 [Canna indica]|uniref:Uncharacterized protein n=1 Tax=Canna indica TaxID=4628 RepID=A0AAQ3L6N1_9LILI|nr:hypothetical protein Cni_G29121 [Canna indica]
MGRASPRLPSFCLNRITTARVRVRSPPPAPPEAKPPPSEQPEEAIKNPKEEAADEAVRSRRIMIVAEATPESKTALLWAFSLSVQSNEAIVLVAIVKPSKRGEQSRKDRDPKSYELLQSMKSICQAKKPEVIGISKSQIMNFILGCWSKDVKHILPLMNCGTSDAPSKNESACQSLIREIYMFLDRNGYICRICLRARHSNALQSISF